MFFHNDAPWVEKALPADSTRFVSGRPELWDGRPQVVHPGRVMDEGAVATVPLVDLVCPPTDELFPAPSASVVTDRDALAGPDGAEDCEGGQQASQRTRAAGRRPQSTKIS